MKTKTKIISPFNCPIYRCRNCHQTFAGSIIHSLGGGSPDPAAYVRSHGNMTVTHACADDGASLNLTNAPHSFMGVADLVSLRRENFPAPTFKGKRTGGLTLTEFWQAVIASKEVGRFPDPVSGFAPLFKLVRRPGGDHWLYLRPTQVFLVLTSHYRAIGQGVVFDLAAVTKQLKNTHYWVKPTQGNYHKQRFSHGGEPESCWCINLALHDQGKELKAAFWHFISSAT